MSIWAGFGAELPKAYENNRRRRVDNLNAFNEFKKGNPYATGAEFQQFIDTAAGNSNYLRGGLPGKDIIAAIDKENAGNRERREMERFVTEQNQMGVIDGHMSAQIDQAILNLPANATLEDYNKAYTDTMNTLPEGAGRAAYGSKAQPRFNQGYRSNLVTGQIRENLPNALTFMKSSAGSGVTAADLGAYFKLPTDVAEGLFARTNELYNQEQLQLQQQSYSAAVEAGLRLIEKTPDINTTTLTANIKALYPSIKDQFQGDFFAKVAADALEKERIAREDRERTIKSEASVLGNSITGAAEDSKLTQAAIFAGDQAGWTQNLLDKFKQEFTDEHFELYFGKKKDELDKTYFDSKWTDLVGIARADQRRKQEATRAAGRSAAMEQQQNYIKTNATIADDLFSYAGAEGKVVETLLSQSYDMNSFFAQAAAARTNEIVSAAGEDGILPEQIVAQLKADRELMSYTKPISAAATEYGNQMLQINGAFDVEEADVYFDNFQGEYNEKFDQLADHIEQIMGNDSLNLQQKKALLTQATVTTNNFSTTTMNNLVQRQRRQDNWVLRGSGGYDGARHDMLGQEIEGRSISLGEVLGNAQQEILNQIDAEAADPTISQETSQIATPLFNTTLARVIDNQGSLENDRRGDNAFNAMNNLKSSLRSAAWQRRNDTDKDTWEQHELIKKYLDYVILDKGLFNKDVTIQTRISLDIEEYKKFMADPMGFILADAEFLNAHRGVEAALLGEGN